VVEYWVGDYRVFGTGMGRIDRMRREERRFIVHRLIGPIRPIRLIRPIPHGVHPDPRGVYR